MDSEEKGQLLLWAKLHDITVSGSLQIRSAPEAGLGLFYTDANQPKLPPILLEVPNSMLLTADNIQTFALSQKDTLLPLLRSDTPLPPRETILRFLLFSLHKFNSALKIPHNFYDPYLSHLPDIKPDSSKSSLPPIFWDDDLCERVAGTSLYYPLQAKRRKLQSEYETFSSLWAIVFRDESITYEEYLRAEWLVVSRVLELHVNGADEIAIVPILDFANHGRQFNARYEITTDAVQLVPVSEEIKVQDGAEILISYGPDKGSSELLFTYGFLPSADDYTGEEFVKMPVTEGGPALRYLYGKIPLVELHVDSEGELEWKSEYLWLLSVGPDEGFDVSVVSTRDGDEEILASVQGQVLDGVRGDAIAAAIQEKIGKGTMAAVLELRRVLILERMATGWLNELGQSEWESEGEKEADAPEILRQREERVLCMLLDDLDERKKQLAESPDVLSFLARAQEDPKAESEEDLS
ncbi:hypothetical protein BZA70DRAFT_166000 [Myxozyma melibiosi]|uniref:SET domain-containing protein n=1 Tax=Myxozyma melibiosi TaxID=54550 RepID=A0ABR1F709_9ASCO